MACILRRWLPRVSNMEINVVARGEDYIILPIHCVGEHNLDRLPWVLVLGSRDGANVDVRHEPRIGSFGFQKLPLNDPRTVEQLADAIKEASNSVFGRLELKYFWPKKRRGNMVYVIAEKRPEPYRQAKVVRASALPVPV